MEPHPSHLNHQLLQVERERVMARMSAIPGVTPRPSMSQFVYFEVTEHERVFKNLRKEGVSVRDVSKYEQLKNSLRITVGAPDENERFLDVLSDLMC
ncbi:MAG: aminotransferase class I/II-fold pyridoxal phosphate-dependent enzyme [Planctomycetes bacterium]|nr:aminotransferase class I/II-fold pyridoxal phosphate-dependent enzyme [Planctomycetota bacterium]MCB9891564.1 aminotransferase class I/II-fold pyridoxal phosphate-dependent enzyme [Planctomycetota bacterium]